MPAASTAIAIGVAAAILEDVALIAGGYFLGNNSSCTSNTQYPEHKFEFRKEKYHESEKQVENA